MPDGQQNRLPRPGLESMRNAHLGDVVHRDCCCHDGAKVGEGGKGHRKALQERQEKTGLGP